MTAGAPVHPRNGKAGYTLVEILVALLAAAVLILIVGTLLGYGFQGLTRTKQSVALQRDMRASMVALAQMTHSATSMSFSTSGVYTAWASNRPAQVYRSATSNLFFDPDASTAGGAMQLAYGTLKTFNVTVSSNLATVVLALGTSHDAVSNRVFLYRRN